MMWKESGDKTFAVTVMGWRMSVGDEGGDGDRVRTYSSGKEGERVLE